jgi:hypothetical protein
MHWPLEIGSRAHCGAFTQAVVWADPRTPARNYGLGAPGKNWTIWVSLFFPEIYSERHLVIRKNPDLPAPRRTQKTAKRPLFRRCFSLFLCEGTAKIVKIALSTRTKLSSLIALGPSYHGSPYLSNK